MDGPLLIIAAAGSGKTRVVTRRIAHLLSRGVAGEAILGITFTNKAAGEMTQRVRALVGRSPVTISTFHSFCARILRTYGPKVGIDSNFTIYDRDDRIRLIQRVQEEVGVSRSNYAPVRLEEAISRAKSAFLSVEDYAETAKDFYRRNVLAVYRLYEERLGRACALDFDDLLVKAVRMCRDSPEVLAALAERYRHILVDEYQDTNRAQYLLVELLAKRRRNLCVTGDPDQSIYGWRGANISNILDFEKDYPDARVIRLEQNWRSTKRILEVASAVITRNRLRKERGLWTENEDGEMVELLVTLDEASEADEVARRIEELIAAGTQASQIALFYRTNALSRIYERGLRDRLVPYRIVAGTEFYERREIKDVLAYVRLALNGADDVAFRRIVNVPTRGIGKTTLEKLSGRARREKKPILEVARREGEKGSALPASARKKLAAFTAIVREIQDAVSQGVSGMIMKVIEASGYRAMLAKSGDREDLDRLGNLDELLSAAAEFEKLHRDASAGDWLEQIALVSDVDDYDPEAGAVSLMTLHSAKGLEFDCVFMIAMEDGLLPHLNSMQSAREIEEERRLCYVGITRARKRLVLSRATRRMIEGKTRRQTRSQFIDEIPQRLLNATDLSHQQRDDLTFVGGDDALAECPYAPGDLVRHPAYGRGEITMVLGAGSSLRVEIDFGRVGRKRFLVRYAQLEKINRSLRM